MLQSKTLLIFHLLAHLCNRHLDSFLSTKYSLIIGIVSAQEHFDRRLALRNTWLKSLTNLRCVEYYFVIGKYFCEVPLEDRLFIEECFDWSSDFFNSSSWKNEFSIGLEKEDLHYKYNSVQNRVTEFIFTVAFDISITAVGIVSTVIKNNGNSVFIQIYDERGSLHFSTRLSNTSVPGDDIMWIGVKRLFQKGFEGRIRVESANDFLILDSAACSFRNSQTPSVVQILHPNSKNSCFHVGFKYVLNDIRAFEKFINDKADRLNSRQHQIRTLEQNLDEESSRFKDILFVNAVDVYRNLPLKVLSFFHWISENKAFEYALKTDDDTLVNINKVLAEIDASLEQKKRWQWWSCFRSKWPVLDIGKWKEYNFISGTYPEFPAGSGYVLHETLVKFLHSNFNFLYTKFQGEDVSMGIWLNPLLPIKHVGKFCHWACDNLYHVYSCNVANVDVSEFNRYWNYLKNS